MIMLIMTTKLTTPISLFTFAGRVFSGDFQIEALVATLLETDDIESVLVLTGPVSILCDWLK